MAGDVITDLAALRRYLESYSPKIERTGAVVKSGLDALDRLLEGGFPKGGVTVLSGLSGAGKMTIAAALLRKETREGRPVAWIDASGTLYPPALELAGVDLVRLLMIRGSKDKAFFAAEQIAASSAFGVVVMSGADRWVNAARLRRVQGAVEGRGSCMLLLVEPRTAASVMHVALKLRLQRRGAGIQIEVEKNRSGAGGKRAVINPEAPDPIAPITSEA